MKTERPSFRLLRNAHATWYQIGCSAKLQAWSRYQQAKPAQRLYG